MNPAMLEFIMTLTVIALFPLLITLFMLWFFIIPKPAKEIIKAKLFKQPLAVIGHDSGAVDILRFKPIGEGLMRTVKGEDYKIIPRGDAEFAKKRHILRGARSVFVGYGGKSLLVDIELLAQLEALDRELRKNELSQKAQEDTLTKGELSKKPKRIFGDKLFFLDPKALIKKYFSKMYTPAQLRALAKYCEMKGMEQGTKSILKMVLILTPLLIAGTICFLMIYAMVFAGGAPVAA